MVQNAPSALDRPSGAVKPSIMRLAPFVATLGSLGLLACSSGSPPSAGASDAGADAGPLLTTDCDPLVPTECGFPFPSNVWLLDDPSTPTGKRVAFGKTTLPRSGSGPAGTGTQTNPGVWALADGFSPGVGPLTHLPGATAAGLADPDHISDSLVAASSPTILIEADTGALVPHFAEIDESTTEDANRALMIRPAVSLKNATRYIVAIRRVVDASGAPIAPSPVFQALRDGTASSDPSVGRRRALYADIFAKLAAAGVAKTDLQIAWDFSTASKENVTGWLLKMRDESLAQVGAAGPAYTITSVMPDYDANTALRIDGTMTVPLYLTSPDAGGTMVLGPDHLPKQNGTASYPFLVVVPYAATKGTPGIPLQFGHGLLGDRTQALSFAGFANQYDFVLVATDWIGLSNSDLTNLYRILLGGDASQFNQITDREDQGVLNALLAMRLVWGALAKDPMAQYHGATTIDATKRYYFGGSEGGIMGATYMAVSTDVTRGVITNLGQPYSLLLDRSVDFAPFLTALKTTYPNALDIQLAIGLDQMLWDRSEPSGFSGNIVAPNQFAGTPPHTVLMMDSIGDHQVTTLGAAILARAAGAVTLTPGPRPIFGIDGVSPPYTGSAALVEYDFGLPPVPLTNVPMMQGADPHGELADTPAAISQASHYLLTGEVLDFCGDGGAACSPATDGFDAGSSTDGPDAGSD
jgi:hypothetical protein